jgi:hypothetical protein
MFEKDVTPFIRRLDPSSLCRMKCNDTLSKFSGLRSLNLSAKHDWPISKKALKSMTISNLVVDNEQYGVLLPMSTLSKNVTHLYFFDCNMTDATLSSFTRLKLLYFSHTNKITDKSLSTLTSLKKLNIMGVGGIGTITGSSISLLTNLTSLNLPSHIPLNGKQLLPLSSNLRTLVMNSLFMIDDSDIIVLTNLRTLHLWFCSSIIGYSFSRLTNLRSLLLYNSNNIDANYVKGLTNIGKISIKGDGLAESLCDMKNVTFL